VRVSSSFPSFIPLGAPRHASLPGPGHPLLLRSCQEPRCGVTAPTPGAASRYTLYMYIKINQQVCFSRIFKLLCSMINKSSAFFICLILNIIQMSAQEKNGFIDLELMSQDLLYAIRTNNQNEADSLKTILQSVPFATLKAQVANDDKKKAFWLNIYNAFVQDILTKNAGAYRKRNRFFKNKQLIIAGKKLSFDDIEHGILRRSKAKLSLGYCNTLFPGKWEKALRVQKLDYRIHFALNCGASSCPPIAFYDSNDIDSQLNLAKNAFLFANTTVIIEKKQVAVTALMSWFRADFGGKKGIRKLLVENKIIEDQNFKIVFDDYKWDLELNKYTD